MIGADETGGRVGVTKRSLHVVCTPSRSLIVCHRSRRMDAVDDIGVLPNYQGVSVHDGLAPYDNLGASHAMHLVRHLAVVGEVWDQKPWNTAMTTCLLEAKHAADAARERSEAAVETKAVVGFETRHDEALALAFAVLPAGAPPPRRGKAAGGSTSARPETWPIAWNGTAGVLRFLTDTRIPFTNNGSEQPLRMVKLRKRSAARSGATTKPFVRPRIRLKSSTPRVMAK